MKKFFMAILIVIAIFIFGCASNHYERTENLMGTVVTLKAEGYESKAAIDESFDKIFELVENVRRDIKNLNDSAGNNKFIKITPEVFEMLELAKKYSELTNGAFDVTVGASIDLWRTARKNKILPSDEEIIIAKNLSGYQHLHLNKSDNSAMIDTAGIKINLGGIGKGYGADIARKIFIQHKITDGLIDFGTSTIFAFGKKKIGLKNPRADNDILEIIELENSALSTSGDYEQFFILNGRRYHHIINPKTGMPVENNIAAVSVIVENNIENCLTVADILSTSIFVLGKDNCSEILPDNSTVKILYSK